MLNLKRADGFTMVEVMVALVIFAISLIGVMGISTISVYYNSMSRQLSIASMVGMELVEALQHLSSKPEDIYTSPAFNDTDPSNNSSLSSIDVVNDPPSSPAPEHSEAEIGLNSPEIGGIRFQRYWNVAYVDQNGDGRTDTKVVVVIVRWRSGNESLFHTTTLSTAINKPPGVM